MRKIIAFIICWIIAFSAGYYVIHPSFMGFVEWMGPFIGVRLYTILSLLYILLANPLVYTPVLTIWVTVGLLSGLIVRRRLGGVLTGLIVYFSLFALFALQLFMVFLEVGKVLENTYSLPPLPPGITLSTLTEAPIIGSMIEPMLESMGKFTGEQAMGLNVQIILFQPAVIMVIITISTLAGCYIGWFLEKTFRKKSEKKTGSVSAKTVTPALVFLLVMVSATAVYPMATEVSAQSQDFYSEMLIGVASPDSTAYVASVFIEEQWTMNGINSADPSFNGFIAGLALSYKVHPWALPSSVSQIYQEEPMFRSILQLMPETILILVYEKGVTDANLKAKQVAGMFAKALNLEFKPLSLPSQFTKPVGNYTIFVYFSSVSFSKSSNAIASHIPAEHGGLAEAIWQAYQNGRLTPGATGFSANGSAFILGLVNPLKVKGFFGHGVPYATYLNVIMPPRDTIVKVSSTIAYWLNWIHSPQENHTVKITELLGVEKIKFSPDADTSILLVTASVPKGQVVKARVYAGETSPGYSELKALTQLSNISGGFDAKFMESGSSLSPDDISVTFSGILPLNIRVKKTVDVKAIGERGIVTVTVTITNNDEAVATNVRLDDEMWLQPYAIANAVKVIEGQVTAFWPQLNPGEKVTLEYKVRLERLGVYTLTPAKVEYSYMDLPFQASSNIVYVEVKPPSITVALAQALTDFYNGGSLLLGLMFGSESTGRIVFTTIILLIVVLITFIEVRSALKHFRGKKK